MTYQISLQEEQERKRVERLRALRAARRRSRDPFAGGIRIRLALYKLAKMRLGSNG